MFRLSSKTQDSLLVLTLRTISCIVIVLLIMIIGSLVISAWPAIKTNGIDFLFSSQWNPVFGEYGGLSFIFGTVVTSLLAILMAAPLSIFIALFITEYLPKKAAKTLAILVEMIASIPSIVFGLWGIFYLAPFVKNSVTPFLKSTLGFLPFFQGPSFGIGILSASIILAIMIVPTITSVCRSVFEVIPKHQKETSYALGSTKAEMIKLAIITPSLSGISSAIVLGLGRALGETMAVTMLIGNSPEISASLFSPAATMASVIANEYADANNDLHVASLCYLALLLFIVTFLSNLFAKVIIKRLSHRSGRRK